MEVKARIWNTSVDGKRLYVRYGKNEKQVVRVEAPADIVEAARSIRIGYEGADSVFNVEGDKWEWLRFDGKYIEIFDQYNAEMARKMTRKVKKDK